MEMQTFVFYELIEPVSNRKIETDCRWEALDCYARDWLVYEKHKTIGNPSRFVQAEQIITRAWNNNPEFEEEQDGY